MSLVYLITLLDTISSHFGSPLFWESQDAEHFVLIADSLENMNTFRRWGVKGRYR